MVFSEELLNINFTYGLFCNIQRTMVNLIKLEKEEKVAPGEDSIRSVRLEETDDIKLAYRRK